MTGTFKRSADDAAIALALREACDSIRTRPTPLSVLIPLLQKAADALDAKRVELDTSMSEDARRFAALVERAGRPIATDGGWGGHYTVSVPAWDDTPYSHTRGKGFHATSFAEAVDHLMKGKSA